MIRRQLSSISSELVKGLKLNRIAERKISCFKPMAVNTGDGKSDALGARPFTLLLVPAPQERLEPGLLIQNQGTDAFWSMKLVHAYGKRGDAELFKRNGNLAHSRGRITVKNSSARYAFCQ